MKNLAMRVVRGSSPLARGLLLHERRRRHVLRIIPARAGFTDEYRCDPALSGDHPRSRGVYVTFAAAAVESAGSSPLARGLRRLGIRLRRSGRIIPARAGFTGRRFSEITSIWDHPRSRGVYPPTASSRRNPKGSSPLARGLLQILFRGRRWWGIIPARAGFTTR